MKRFIAIVVLLCASTGAALAAEPKTEAKPKPKAEAPRQLHFKSEMSGFGVPSGLSSETWVKGERLRTVMKTPMGLSTVIVKDKVVYMKAGNIATKMPIEGQGTGPMPRPTDYASRLDEILKDATKVGTEEIGGEECDKWSIAKTMDGHKTEQTLWISPKLKFPRQISVKTEAGEIVVKNSDIETKVTLDEALFEPEPGVNYQDASRGASMAQRPAGGAGPKTEPKPAAKPEGKGEQKSEPAAAPKPAATPGKQ